MISSETIGTDSVGVKMANQRPGSSTSTDPDWVQGTIQTPKKWRKS